MVGRFLLLFISSRLELNEAEAVQQAGILLAGLALVTVLCAPLAGWAADRWGRIIVISFDSMISAAGVGMLVFAASTWQIFAFGALMSLGSAAFASANWALMADLVPKNEPARFFGLANIGTAGTAAAAGHFGPLIDGLNTARPGLGYPALFAAASLMFILSALVMRSVNQPAEVSQTELSHRIDQGGN